MVIRFEKEIRGVEKDFFTLF